MYVRNMSVKRKLSAILVKQEEELASEEQSYRLIPDFFTLNRKQVVKDDFWGQMYKNMSGEMDVFVACEKVVGYVQRLCAIASKHINGCKTVASMLKSRGMTQKKHHMYIIETADSNLLDDTHVNTCMIMDVVIQEDIAQDIDKYFIDKKIEDIMKELQTCVHNFKQFQRVFDSFVDLKSKDLIKQADPEWLLRNKLSGFG
jgi:hypothetical protein